MREINELIVHCAATPPEWMADKSLPEQVDEIRRWHRDRGWSDIGYHYVIGRDGYWMEGRPVEKIGAHVRGRNSRSVGICLIGGKSSNENDQFSDHFTPEQDAALRKMLETLSTRFPKVTRISGHNQYAAKACPGFQVQDWLKETPPQQVAPKPTGFAALIAAIFSIFRGKA